MKNPIILFLIFSLSFFITFSSCSDKVINNNLNPEPDFDIYLVKRDFQNNLISTYTIKSDGSELKLFNDSMGVSNYSYRNKILLTKGGFSFNDIYIANYDGSNMTKIPMSNYQVYYCNLSPDAEKLYFISGSSGMDLYTVNADGSGLVQITDQLSSFYSVKFSPDGKMIAYLETSYFPNHRGTKLFISNTSGTYKKLLKDSIQDGGSVDWSSDGKKIIFHFLVTGMYVEKIGVIDTAISNFTVLANGYFPAWSPNGGKICFVSSNGTNTELYLMNEDGSNIINVSNIPGINPYYIKWSKDGMRILYRSIEGSNPAKLWMYDLNANSNTLLADSVYDAVWQ
ncbi:MAG: WD40-like Beta Propeller [Chlorobi bacterium OLB5]|nr:MAG: WD40-like Beta Propeller [Chlorobi bacterium OLB5]